MNSKRSVWKVLLGVVGVGLLVTNCTIKTDDSCTPGRKKNCSACENGVTGSQTCLDDHSYGECVCPGSVNGGSSNAGGSTSAGSSSGGASNAAGSGNSTSNGGAATSEAGAGGEGGEAGDGTLGLDPTDCYGCLNQLCAIEWEQCVAEDENKPESAGNYCLSSG